MLVYASCRQLARPNVPIFGLRLLGKVRVLLVASAFVCAVVFAQLCRGIL